MEELLCYYRNLSDISKDISVSTQPLRKVGGKEQLCYFKEKKKTMGHLAYGITAFLISKLMFIEHNVTDTKKKKKCIKLPFALKKINF